jgi:hypothetical protein
MLENINTINWEDLPAQSRDWIHLQQQAFASVVTHDGHSMNSSITGATSATCSDTKCGSITLHQDIVILLSDSTKSPIPIAIHSRMAHAAVQTSLISEEQDCPALRCVFDSSAALSTANFHFMEAMSQQYPHILKKNYLPFNYVAIVLSGIFTNPDSMPITTELNIRFDIHLPYSTKDGNTTSLLVAASPDFTVNLILSLPFIKAMVMFANFVDIVCEAKNMLSNLFPINFNHAIKNIPIFVDASATKLHGRKEKMVLSILSMLWSVYECENTRYFILSSHPLLQPVYTQLLLMGMHLETGWSTLTSIGPPQSL